MFSGEAVRPTIPSAVLDQVLVEEPLEEPVDEPDPELLVLGAGAAAGAEVVEEPESDEPPAGVLLDEPAASELLVDEVDELPFELPPRLSVL